MSKSFNNKYLEFKKINFGYEPNKQILFDISFSIKKNEKVCIVGANGCGKSTLAKIIAGLFKPWSGTIAFLGLNINSSSVKLLKEKTGIIFENPDNQFIGLTVEDDIAFSLENKCVPHNKMQSIINRISKSLGIYDVLKADVRQLSGGQKQLVALASVLVMNPDLIILDEATSMLDNDNKKKFNNLIFSLKNKTIITITHDMDEASKADRIIVLNKGKIVLNGTPTQIFENKIITSFSLDIPLSFQYNQFIKNDK